MIVNVGMSSLVIAFAVCLYAAGAAIRGVLSSSPKWVASARQASLAVFPLLSFSVLCLVLLLIYGHFEVEYVSSVTSTTMPVYLKLSALWGGQAGSLLFWSWLMAGFAAILSLRDWRRDAEFLPWTIVVTASTTAFFLLLIIFFENPFEKLWLLPGGQVVKAFLQPGLARLFVPREGLGLNPLLRHPGMILHPPMLYLGFVGFVIPYAYAIAALVTKRLDDDRWIQLSRRWMLFAWLFLSLGLILGARWAYDVLGWGGYWGWDPVEIAAFIPWLSGTAFLHSVMIQEKRGMLKRWNMILIILSYAMVIFGTFLTRSGVLSSVHAFAQSALGPAFFIFIGSTFIISLALLLSRWSALGDVNQMTSLFSREALFLINNLLFIGILIVCVWGILFPLISELVTGQKVTVGPPFYERATGPLFAAILLLMGVAPLSAWGYSTAHTFGTSLWKPGVLSLITVAALAAFGTHDWRALIGFGLVSLVFWVILIEMAGGVRARQRRTKESYFVSLIKLIKRNRRRYGAYVIHIGVVLMALGILGIELFQSETQATIPQGGKIQIDQYTIVYDSLTTFDAFDGRNVARAVLQVYKDGDWVAQLHPRRDYYYDSEQPVTIPGIHSTWEDDVYVLLIDWLPISSEGATFKVYHNPLVTWLWAGALVFIFGTIIAASPEPDSARQLISSRTLPSKDASHA
jgi:cytochrome c-type biogenesis protein CcmF